MSQDIRVPIGTLRELVAGIFVSGGVKPEHARTTADRMIESDVRGVRTHGVFRVAQYLDLLRAGKFNVDPDIRVVNEAPASALVDGDDALGHVSMTMATDVAGDKAQASGSAWVGIMHGNHAGALSVYIDRLVERGLAAIIMGVAQANRMPPWGGVEPLLASNPIAFGVPAGDEGSVVFDIATSIVAVGHIRRAAAAGESIPEGWLVDAEGQPITDPGRLSEGLLQPFGEHKGYGLALMIGLMAGAMNGASFGSDVVDPAKDPSRPSNTGHTIIAMDPGSLRDPAAAQTDVAARVREFKTSRPIDPDRPVRVPGDRGAAQRHEMETQGVPLDPALVTKLEALRVESGVTTVGADWATSS